ncbi:HK97 family phage prohead protease [Companilactobacillus jidongensis]|uniref:HK97 family phage prohead protease n=1 Tax=Companilactobacillus jidongensis TaxID=2486006 RepID=UPI000F77A099|nr:HK97 family phage prohead protease [Companilactobacillus jidongensis]
MSKVQELRAIENGELKIEKRSDENSADKLSGYAIVFDQPSEDLGGFIEYVDRSALDGVDLSDVKLLYNHKFDNILARVDSNTLLLTIDEHGLFFSADIPNTTIGNDVAENVRNGNLKGCSFGFTISGDAWENMDNDVAIRHITKVESLYELSITPMPAYKETSVSQRSLDEFNKEKYENKNSSSIDELELFRLENDLYD